MARIQASEPAPLSHTLQFGRALLPDGWAENVEIDIADGLIHAIRTDCAGISSSRSSLTVVSGLPNLHSHAFQRGMSGRTEYRLSAKEDSFWTWREQLYKFIRNATPDDIKAISALAFAEMLEGGFTRVCEFHYLHNTPAGSPYTDPAEIAGQVAQAANAAGIGLTLLPVFYAQGGFGGQPPSDGQERFLNTLDSFSSLLDHAERHCETLEGAVVGVAPHSLRAVTHQQLAAMRTFRPDKPIHIHIAEQIKEVEACLEWSRARPVEWLLEHADVDEHWCLVHATHTDETERGNIAKSGAVAGLCPITEANLGDGIFELPVFLKAGGLFGVGSDSNVSIDAADELRLLEYSQRLRFKRRNVINTDSGGSSGRMLYEAALEGGRRASGTSARLAPGHSADMLVLAPSEILSGKDTNDAILDEWVFRRGKASIAEVWVRGGRMVEQGRHVRRSEFEADFLRALKRILD
ncbi:formimidoylglutamate deiminase [Henriciella sp. AS95]|uniref:formimidoylglutamate deiminase n=1 Tax=Henriciella sp. AS95 TaxID=3135782 RepID=UPI003175A761